MESMGIFETEEEETNAEQVEESYKVGDKSDLKDKDNASYDTNFKKFFQRKEVLAGILLNVVKEFEGLSHAEVVQRIKSSSINPLDAELLNSEDNKESQKILYDIVTVVNLNSAKEREVHLIFDLEMQRHYDIGYAIMSRAIYYTSRLIARQYLENADYNKLIPVQSTWICIFGVPKELCNKSLHFEYTAHENGLVRDDIHLKGQDLTRIDMLFLSEDYFYNANDSDVIKFLQSIFHYKLHDKNLNHYVEVTEEIESEVRGIMLENERYLEDMEKITDKKSKERIAEAEAKAEAEVERTRFSLISYLLSQNKTGDEVVKELAAMQEISEEEAGYYYNKYTQVR